MLPRSKHYIKCVLSNTQKLQLLMYHSLLLTHCQIHFANNVKRDKIQKCHHLPQYHHDWKGLSLLLLWARCFYGFPSLLRTISGCWVKECEIWNHPVVSDTPFSWCHQAFLRVSHCPPVGHVHFHQFFKNKNSSLKVTLYTCSFTHSVFWINFFF